MYYGIFFGWYCEFIGVFVSFMCDFFDILVVVIMFMLLNKICIFSKMSRIYDYGNVVMLGNFIYGF